ncbi:MAG: hypothetical protein K2G24_02175 [Muribaculaceae bacterium]|nr:hypothetical protein [Muribaculaceae bacterium]
MPESTEAEELGELKVEGHSRYINGNQITFIPTKDEKKISRGGIELIRTMALADLYVDPMSKTVTTASGNGVAFFIDMQPATQVEVDMLRAMDIQTVEYFESPSDPRFHGARYAINYVLVKYDYGGYTIFSGQQNFIQNYGDYRMYSRYTKGKMLYDLGGGFNYASDSHIGSDKLSVYNFPDFPLEKHSISDGASASKRTGYGTLRATYQSQKVNIANTLSLSGANTPHSLSHSLVNYNPALFPEEESRRYSHNSNLSAVWSGNYFFELPADFSLTVTPTASYSKFRNAYSFSEGSTFHNDSRDKSWKYNLLAELYKKFGNMSIGARLSTEGSGNSVTYTGTESSKSHGHTQGGLANLSANFEFGKLWGAINAGVKFSSQTVSGLNYKSVSPSYFFQTGYNFSRQSSINMFSNYTPYTVPMSQKTDNFVLRDKLDGVRGNPSLKNGQFFNIGLQYRYMPNRIISLSAFWTFTRTSNMIIDRYTTEIYQGYPIMVRSWLNHGFMNHHNYGLNLSVKCLNSKLRLNGGIRGNSVARHSMQNYSATHLDFFGQALYMFGQFYASASYNYHRTNIGNSSISKSPSYYSMVVGWGNGNWNISATAFNPSVGNYKSRYSLIDTPEFSSRTQSYSSSYHRLFVLNVSYSFSYGKKVNQTNQVGQLQGGASGILDYE